MSLAKVIGPDIEELIRENPAELAGGGREHPPGRPRGASRRPAAARTASSSSRRCPPSRARRCSRSSRARRCGSSSTAPRPAKLGAELDRLPADEVTFLLEHLTQRQREAILAKMSPRDAAEVERLLALPAAHRGPPDDREVRHDPSGVDRRRDARPPEAHRPRGRDGPEPLRGGRATAISSATSSLRRLFPAPPDRKIADMMERRLLTVHTDAPQEEVARLVSKYDVHAIPVVDEENRLLGHRDGRRRHRHPDRGADRGRPAHGRRLGHRGDRRAGLLRDQAASATCACASTGCC